MSSKKLSWQLNRADELVLSEITLLSPEPTDRTCPMCGEDAVCIADEDHGVDWADKGRTRYHILLRCESCGAFIRETWKVG